MGKCFVALLFSAALLASQTATATTGINITGGSCVEYAFSENLFAPGKTDPTGRYVGPRAVLQKKHIVCMGDVVSVTQPVFTNGGDFIVLANEVKLDFPIDTRVYVDHGADDVEAGAVSAVHKSIVEGFYRTTTDAVRADGTYTAGPADRFPEAPHAATKKGGTSNLPRRCRTADTKLCGDGEFLGDALDSGNISIVMNTLRLCEGCEPNEDGFPLSTSIRAVCPAIPRPSQHALLQAASIRPSRGAFGVEDCTTGTNSDKPVCKEAQYARFAGNGVTTIGELTAAYDAGTIEVVFAGANASAYRGKERLQDPVAETRARSDASVLPPHVEAFAQIDQRRECIASGGAVCCLRPLPPYQGRAGVRQLANILYPTIRDEYKNVPTGLSTIAAALEALDEHLLAKDQLVSLIAETGVATTFSPSDQLSAFLWEAGLESTARMVDLTAAHWPAEPAPGTDVRPSVLRGRIDNDAPPSGLSNYHLSLAQSVIGRFEMTTPGKPIRSYLYNLNGIVAVQTADPKAEFDLANAKRAQEQLISDVKKAVIELQKLNLHNFDTVSQVQLADMAATVARIRGQLEEAEAYAKRKGWEDIARTIGQAIKTVKDLYKNLGDGKWKETGQNVADLIRNIRNIEDAAHKIESPAELRVMLVAALNQQQQLQAQIAESRRRLVEEIVHNAGELEASFARYNDYSSQAKQLADELYRNLLIRYGSDGAAGYDERLRRRLSQLRTLLVDYPNDIPNFSDVAASEKGCSSAPKNICDSDWGSQKLDCVALPVAGAPYVIQTTADYKRFPSSPLFVAAGDTTAEQPFQRLATREQVVLPPGLCAGVIKPAPLPTLAPSFAIENPSGSGAGVDSIGDDVFIQEGRQTHVYRWSGGNLQRLQTFEGSDPRRGGDNLAVRLQTGVAVHRLIDGKWERVAVNPDIIQVVAIDETALVGQVLQEKQRVYASYALPDIAEGQPVVLTGPMSQCATGFMKAVVLWQGHLAGGCRLLDGAGAVVIGFDASLPTELVLDERHSNDSFGEQVILHGDEMLGLAHYRWQIDGEGKVLPTPILQRYRFVDNKWLPAGTVELPVGLLPESISIPGGLLVGGVRLLAMSERFLVISLGTVGVLYENKSGTWEPTGLFPGKTGRAHADNRAVYVGASGRIDVYEAGRATAN